MGLDNTGAATRLRMVGNAVRHQLRTAMLVPLLATALALGACGGGGGGGGGGGDGGSPPPSVPVVITSGLVPTATAAGATLETDAGRLRVLRAGATWRYTGVVRGSGAPASTYTSVVTQTAVSAGVLESGTNPFGEGPDSQTVRIEAGAVKMALPLTELGVARTIDFVELRSPVRTGDQITQFDERVADALADVDGDGRREALDLAIWTRVIGEETIDLLHRPGLRAVRVDTFIAARLRPSSPAAPVQPVVTSVQRNWYVAGVGLVRSEAESQSTLTPGANDLTVEELESWDGLTEGLGALPPVAGMVPGGAALGAPLDAVAFSDHAVMIVGGPGAGAPVLASVNRQGAVTATYPINIADSSPSFDSGKLLRVNDGLRLITRVLGATPGVVMTARGNDGQPSGGAPVRLIDTLPRASPQAGQPAIATASTANRLWLVWMRAAANAAPDAVLAVDIVLQGFAADGTALSAPRVLTTLVDSRDVYAFNVAATSTHVLVSWADRSTGVEHPYAVFEAGSGAELGRRTTTALPPFVISSVPLAVDGQLALSWQGNSGGAVLLDAGFNAVPSATGDWQGNVLPPAPMLGVGGPVISVDNGSLLLWGTQSDLREPLYGNGLTTLALMSMPAAGTGPLGSRAMQIHARLPLSSGQPLIVDGVLVFADRMLVYGHSNNYTLVTVPVWRRN